MRFEIMMSKHVYSTRTKPVGMVEFNKLRKECNCRINDGVMIDVRDRDHQMGYLSSQSADPEISYGVSPIPSPSES